MLKAGKLEFSPLLAKIFNLILIGGCFPENWSLSFLKPLYKSGSVCDPSNYRGICLSSCLGKLFCSVLNQRLVKFLEENEMYKPNQIAFRAGYRTSDHMFVLKTLIDKYVRCTQKNGKNNLYICFIDLRKAFDNV